MRKKFFYLFLIFITFFIIYITLNPQYNKNTAKENNSPFSISKIIFYSGIIPKSTSFSNNYWNLEISQYTDIAIYINNSSEDELTSSNTVQSLYIDNIQYSKKPTKGNPKLYYQNPLKFASENIYSDYVIDNHLSYNILNFDNTDNFNYYSTPSFFSDCSNPITIKYVNFGVVENYTFSNKNTLVFNGSILKDSNISLEDLNSQVSFTINIVSNDKKLYKYDAKLNIPVSNSENTLFEQNIYLEETKNENFYEVTSDAD